jgi:hypothetical protein
MADEREEEKPRIQVVDRRMLSEDERAGKSSGEEAPKLEIVGGFTAQQNPNEVPDSPEETPLEDEDDSTLQSPMVDPDDDREPLSAEDVAAMQAEIEAAENEQFSVIEQRMGPPSDRAGKECCARRNGASGAICGLARSVADVATVRRANEPDCRSSHGPGSESLHASYRDVTTAKHALQLTVLRLFLK